MICLVHISTLCVLQGPFVKVVQNYPHFFNETFSVVAILNTFFAWSFAAHKSSRNDMSSVLKWTFFQISFVRHRDIHLLTVGRDTYTSDQRFQALHKPHTNEWTLQIRYPQVSRAQLLFSLWQSTFPPIQFNRVNGQSHFLSTALLSSILWARYTHYITLS